MIRTLEFAPSYRCNMRCLMCSYWKIKVPELSIKKIKEGFKDLKVGHVSVSGGEPLMYPNLVELLNFFFNSDIEGLCLNTNGYFTKKIEELLGLIERNGKWFSITVSLDGIGEIYDKIRGIKCFDRVKETLKLLKGRENVWINMTILPENYNQIKRVYLLSKKYDFGFLANLAQPPSLFHNLTDFQLKKIEEQFEWIIADISKRIKNKEFCTYIWQYIHTYNFRTQVPYYNEGKRPLPCYCGKNYFVVNPLGDVYPCANHMWRKTGYIVPIKETQKYYGNEEYKIGNIREKPFMKIVKTRKAKKIFWKCNECNECWGSCSFFPAVPEWIR